MKLKYLGLNSLLAVSFCIGGIHFLEILDTDARDEMRIMATTTLRRDLCCLGAASLYAFVDKKVLAGHRVSATTDDSAKRLDNSGR